MTNISLYVILTFLVFIVCTCIVIDTKHITYCNLVNKTITWSYEHNEYNNIIYVSVGGEHKLLYDSPCLIDNEYPILTPNEIYYNSLPVSFICFTDDEDNVFNEGNPSYALTVFMLLLFLDIAIVHQANTMI